MRTREVNTVEEALELLKLIAYQARDNTPVTRDDAHVLLALIADYEREIA